MNVSVFYQQFARQLLAILLVVLSTTALISTHGAQAGETSTAPVVQQVNINKADAAALAAGLKGVGQARAEEIVRYRESFGPFTSADELLEVKGIGKSTLERNRGVIALE